MDGYVRRVVAEDGYVLVKPFDFLLDGYQYDIYHNGSVIVSAISLALMPNQIVLYQIDSAHPLTVAKVGDLVKLKS
jgi:hypothetical protein